VIGDQFLGSADSDDFPVPEERDAVGQPLDLVHRVTREEDGRSAARESLYQSVDRSPAGRVDPRGRLVKEEEVGVVDDGGGDAGPALLPARERLVPHVRVVGHPHVPQDGLGVARRVVEPAVVADQFGRREPLRRVERLREQPDPLRVDLARRDTEHPQVALGLGRPRQRADQRRLPRAVWADESEHLAGLDPDVDAVERDDVAVRLADAFADDDRVGIGGVGTGGVAPRVASSAASTSAAVVSFMRTDPGAARVRVALPVGETLSPVSTTG